MTALAPSYDFFMYYFTLVITPMMLLCGVFFPVDAVAGGAAGRVAAAAADPRRRSGAAADERHGAGKCAACGVLIGYTLAGFYVSLVLFRRRLASADYIALRD